MCLEMQLKAFLVLIMLSRYRDRDRDFPGFTDPDQSRDPEIYRDRD